MLQIPETSSNFFFLNLYLLNDAENIEGCNRHGTKISDLCILPSSSEEQVVKHDQAKSLPWEPHVLCLFHDECSSSIAIKLVVILINT